MFRMAPSLFRTSENKIRLGLEFFLETVKLQKSTLVQRPTLLMFSMKERVIPRYRVFQLITSKKLMKKDPKFYDMMCLTEHHFLEKYVSRFTENVEELLMAYKGHRLDLGEEYECFLENLLSIFDLIGIENVWSNWWHSYFYLYCCLDENDACIMSEET
uniref:Putative ovule protein n=1 Tax=Solanum chacoense TaxID=4108 RepID=A0A0V0HG29_SOLCH